MLYKFKEGKILTKAVEYSVAYHCNLRCSSCSHLAPFQKKKFPSLESFGSDLDKLSSGLHAKDLRLVGGEPLLHPKINDFLKIAKEVGIADTIGRPTLLVGQEKTVDNLFPMIAKKRFFTYKESDMSDLDEELERHLLGTENLVGIQS